MTSNPISRVSPTPNGTVALSSSTDVLIVGTGPTGSAAAIHTARAGFPVTVVGSQRFPRNRTCDDGLAPRAIAELRRLGLDDELLHHNRNRELKLHGFGGSITAPWPDDTSDTFPTVGSAMSRVELDTFLFNAATDAGAQVFDGVTTRKVVFGALSSSGTRGHGMREMELSDREGKPHTISARWLLVAGGARSTVGKQLRRAWHRDSVFGVAAWSCVSFDSVDVTDDWIHSHLKLRDSEGQTHSGCGRIFPLGAGQVDVGYGALATSARPARANVKKLLREYHGQVREQWQMSEPEHVTLALLPTGSVMSNVAEPNWTLLGGIVCLANPLSGGGIDYGIKSVRLAVELISSIGAGRNRLTHSWPVLLRRHCDTSFSLTRKLALTLTYPSFLLTIGPLTIGAPWGGQLMGVTARLMENLVTKHDRNVATRLWRTSRRTVLASDRWFGRQP